MKAVVIAEKGLEVRDVPAAKLARGYRWENDAWSLEPTMPHGVFGAMGGVVTSADDYVKWVSFLLDAWPARDGAEKGPGEEGQHRPIVARFLFRGRNV